MPGQTSLPFGTLALAVAVVTANTLPVFLLGAAAVEMGAELGFGPRGLGVLTGVFFLTGSAFSVPAGRVVERIGWRVAMRRITAASSVVLLAIAAGARSIWVLGVLLFAGSLVYAGGNPAANQALARAVRTEDRGKAFGLKHAGIPMSGLLSGLAVPVIVTTVGWRWGYAAAAVFAAVVAMAVPRDVEEPELTQDLPEGGEYRPKPRLALLAVAAVFATFAPIALGSFGVTAAVDAGFSLGAAGLLLAGGSLVSIAARVAAGAVVDARRGRGIPEIVMLLMAGCAVLVVMAVADGALFGVAMLVAFGTAWAWPGLLTFAVVRAHPGAPASASAVLHLGLFLGAGLAPVGVGVIAEWSGFSTVWLVVSLSSFVSLSLLAVVDRAQEWRMDYDMA